MPAIIGVVGRSGDESPERLRMMIRPLRRNPAWGVDQVQITNGGLAAIRRDEGPAVASSAGVWLAVNGTVFQQDDLVRRLKAAGRPVPPDAPLSRILLEYFLAFGPTALTGLNGSYALAVWEEAPQRLTLINDRYGTANLYYWHTPGRLAFASEYKAIAAHPDFSGSIDEIALADFLIFRQVNSDRTFFNEIRSVPPASVLIYQQDTLRIEDHWDLPVGQYRRTFVSRMATTEDIVFEWAHHLENAVRRQSFPETCLLITAGLDSRLLAACFKQVNPQLDLTTTTIGVDGCREIEIGRQVAAALGYAHEQLLIDTTYLARHAAQAAWRGEGKLNAFAAWIYRQESYLLENGLRYAMTGILGNAISGRYFPERLKTANGEPGEDLLRSSLGRKVEWLKSVMRPEVFHRAAPASLDAYSEAYRRSRADDPYGRYDELYFRYILPRHAWKDEVLGDAAESLAPYLDNDLVDFSLSIPPSLRAGGRLYRQMIVEHFPAIARLASDRSGHSIFFDHWLDGHPVLQRADHLARRAYRRFIRSKADPDSGGCVPHNEAVRTGSRQFVLDVLAQEDYLADFFDTNAVRAAVQDHLAGRRDLFWLIGGLVTISLWRQQFFGNAPEGQTTGAEQPYESKSH